MKKRKTTIDKNRISDHTRRFRASTGPIITVRSLASVGGATRRAMAKKANVDTTRLAAFAMLPAWMQTGLGAFAKLAQAFTAKHEEAQRAKRAARG